MNGIINNLIHGFHPFSDKSHGTASRLSMLDLQKKTEYTVDAIDPKIRAISRYARKLSSPIEITEYYLENLLHQIPGELSVGNEHIAIDPRVALFFSNAEQMKKVFSTSEELLEFLAYPANRNLQYVYVLLCMEKSERISFGVRLKGEILLREVKQNNVIFSNQRLLAPAATAEQARQGFKQCAYDGLLRKVHETISQYGANYEDLVKRKADLFKKLKAEHVDPNLVNSITGGPYSWLSRHPEARHLEEEIRKQKLNISSPETHLHHLREVLSHPEDYIRVKATSFTLDRYGVLLTGSSQRYGYKINLAEVEVDQSSKRYTVVIRYPTRELEKVSQQSMHTLTSRPAARDIFG